MSAFPPYAASNRSGARAAFTGESLFRQLGRSNRQVTIRRGPVVRLTPAGLCPGARASRRQRAHSSTLLERSQRVLRRTGTTGGVAERLDTDNAGVGWSSARLPHVFARLGKRAWVRLVDQVSLRASGYLSLLPTEGVGWSSGRALRRVLARLAGYQPGPLRGINLQAARLEPTRRAPRARVGSTGWSDDARGLRWPRGL